MDWSTLYPNPHTPGCFWHKYAVLTGSPNVKWCEETLCQFISEPANTWSNLLYFIVALVIWNDMRKSGVKVFSYYPPIIFFMGLCSFIYHLSNIYLTQILDFVGMFLFVGWCIAINFIRLKKLKEKQLWPFLIIFTLAMSGVLHVLYISSIKVQATILVCAIVIGITEFMAKAESRKWFFVSGILLIVALGFSIADHKRAFCDIHDHFIQGHAIWHSISAIGLGFIWPHYKQFKTLS